MKITNKFNLPNGLYEALAQMSYVSDDYNTISVSDLINPPLIWYLKKQHKDEIEEDASERLWALLGASVHYMISKAESKNLTEERIEADFDGIRIVGRFDVYTEEKEIIDYKITSVWSYIFGDKPEWEKQLNVYAYLLRRNGFEVEKAKIYAILRDWNRRDVKEDYPEIPFVVIDIPLWSYEEQEKYIKDRITMFREIQSGNIEQFHCDEKDRWARGGGFALMQKGKKRAIKLFDELPDGLVLSEDQYIEERPKEYIRCKAYCPVRQFCQFNPYKGGEENGREGI